MTVRYTTGDSTLGRVLLAATDRGVCGIAIGDTDREVVAFAELEFPGAVSDPAGLADWFAALCVHLTGDTPETGLPLDARGTVFQRRVWDVLRRIPRGETRTYREVAAGIGNTAAVRAVARACATNPVSVLIPCHRVIGSDGRLTGYRWGLARKRALLARERLARVGAL